MFRAHEIGFFFYNGGGDLQDTTHKVSQISVELGEPIVCVGIPKTVDDDLAITDCSPGFGSARNTSPPRFTKRRSTWRR